MFWDPGEGSFEVWVLYVTCNSVTWGMCLLCRYEECKTKLTPFLKKVGFNP